MGHDGALGEEGGGVGAIGGGRRRNLDGELVVVVVVGGGGGGGWAEIGGEAKAVLADLNIRFLLMHLIPPNSSTPAIVRRADFSGAL